MGWTRRTWMGLAAVSGLFSVVVGAFGAHRLTDPLAKDLMKTGASYEAIHALAIIGCTVFIEAGANRAGWAPAPFLAGSLLFSGSLYAMALGGPRWLGVFTPAGGLLLLTGWAVLAWACLAPGKADSSKA